MKRRRSRPERRAALAGREEEVRKGEEEARKEAAGREEAVREEEVAEEGAAREGAAREEEARREAGRGAKEEARLAASMSVRKYTATSKLARRPLAAKNTSSNGSTAPKATAATDARCAFQPPAADQEGSRCSRTLAKDGSATVAASGHSKDSVTSRSVANAPLESNPTHSPTPELPSGKPHETVRSAPPSR